MQASRDYKRQIASSKMLTCGVTLSGIVLCRIDRKGVQLVRLTASLHNNQRETTVSSNLFNFC